MEQLNNNEYNILVVEDDKEIRDGIEIFLKSQGYHVYKAADGVEGLEVIGRETIHLAIVDIMMPRMDGVTMTIKLRVTGFLRYMLEAGRTERVAG